MKSKIFIFAPAFLAAILILTSCESLDDTVERSRNGVASHGNDLYWKGEKVGVRKFSGSAFFEDMLKSKGLWVESSGTVTKFRTRTDKKTGMAYQEPYTEFVRTEIGDLENIFDANNTLLCSFFTQCIPRDTRCENHLYRYDYRTKSLTELPNPDNSGVITKHDSEALLTTFASELFTVQSRDGQSFESISRQTLANETEARSSKSYTGYLQSGVSVHSFLFPQSRPRNAHTEIESTVKPIVLGYLNGGVTFMNTFFRFDYETDFGLRGGSVKSGNEAKETFNLNSNASFLLRLAGGYRGVEINYLTEHFQFGSYDYYTSTSETSPKLDRKQSLKFETKRKNIEILYHFAWKDIERLGGTSKRRKQMDYYVGYNYVSFKSVKISYEELNEDNDKETDEKVVGESTPQLIEVKAHLVGGGLDSSLLDTRPGLNIIRAGCLYIGPAQCHFNGYDYYYDPDYISEKEARGGNATYPLLYFGGAAGLAYNTQLGPVTTSLYVRYDLDIYFEMGSFTSGDEERLHYSSSQLNCFSTISAGANCYF